MLGSPHRIFVPFEMTLVTGSNVKSGDGRLNVTSVQWNSSFQLPTAQLRSQTAVHSFTRHPIVHFEINSTTILVIWYLGPPQTSQKFCNTCEALSKS